MTRPSALELTPTMISINQLLYQGLRPREIQNELKISIKTYYNLISKINEYNNSPEMRSQYEEQVNSYWGKLFISYDVLLIQTEDIGEKNQILSNMIKLNKEFTDYLFRVGKIKEVSKKVEIESNVKVDYHNLYEIYLEEKKAKQLPSGNVIDQQSNRSSV